MLLLQLQLLAFICAASRQSGNCQAGDSPSQERYLIDLIPTIAAAALAIARAAFAFVPVMES